MLFAALALLLAWLVKLGFLRVFKTYNSSVYVKKKSDCNYNYEPEKQKQTKTKENSKSFISPINLIIAIIIKYQLSFKRSSLEFTVIYLFCVYSAPTLSWRYKRSFAFALFASPFSSSCWLRDHARCQQRYSLVICTRV